MELNFRTTTKIANFIARHINNKPRYLYHLAPQNKCESILKDGLKPSMDRILNTEGVFTIEADNFLTNWTNSKINGESLVQMLLDQVNWQNSGISIFKINTDSLASGKLFMRNQIKLFDLYNSEKYSTIPKNPIKLFKALSDFVNIRFGFPVKFSRLFNSKSPYEYIYKGTVPKENIEHIKTIDKPNVTDIINVIANA